MPGMPIPTTGINLKRNFNFPREFARNVIKNTDVKVRKEAGNIEKSAAETRIELKDYVDRTEEASIKSQKNKKPQDRFIDLYT